MMRSFSMNRLVLPAVFLFAMLALPDSVTMPKAETEGCGCIGRVGNVDCDYRDEVTMLDLLYLVDHLYISERRLPNPQEANCNGDPYGAITIGDVSALIDYLYINGRELPLCPQPYNSPPVTYLAGFAAGTEYINAESPEHAGTGIPLMWAASDIIDHPYYPIDYEYEYRLYGPYTPAEFAVVTDSFAMPVFRSYDGRMFPMDNSHIRMQVCDTSYDGGVETIVCDSILIDTIWASNDYGFIDTLVRFEDDDFVGSEKYNRLALHSGDYSGVWITDTSAVLHDAFNAFPSDTTWKAYFMVWVRAREKDDTLAVDPTPEFATCQVIDPHFERDVLVTNWSLTANENSVTTANVKAYWRDAVNAWIDRTGRSDEVDFDIDRDYARLGAAGGLTDLQTRLLRYKTVIVSQDGAVSGLWASSPDTRETVYAAMTVGVNVWAATRIPVGGFSFGQPADAEWNDDYEYFFGLQRYYYTGWSYYYLTAHERVEDFCGAIAVDAAAWPSLAVDSARLHSLYKWDAPPWDPAIAALPEVGWAPPAPQAEVVYLYKSIYGSEHPLHPELSFQGWPVMCRLDRGVFRSVQSLFTPISLEQPSAQVMVDSVLNWLYDGSTVTGLSPRYSETPSLTREAQR